MKLVATIITFIIFILLIGCSGNYDQITQPKMQIDDDYSFPVGVTDKFPDNSPAGGIGMLGLFDLSIDPSNVTASLTPIRNVSLTDVLEIVDITNFLELAPCIDCVKLGSIWINPDGYFVLSLGIKHPFAPGDPLKPISGQNRADLHVFNIEGIVVSNSPATNFPGINELVSGMNLVSADGLSGYLDNSLDDIFPTDATVHPYVIHFDDYSAGNFAASNPMGFASVTNPPPSGNLVMAMGSDYDFQDYVFKLDGSVNFIYAIGCTYAVSAASKNDRFTPEYRIPQHNKKAASEVSIEIISNDLGGGQVASSAEIEIHVVDINHGVAVGPAFNEMLADSSVATIEIDIPGVMLSPLSVDGGTPVSGDGHDPTDPLIYSATVQNTAAGDMGIYPGLVKVLDSYAPGQNEAALLNGKDGIKRVDPAENPLAGLFDIAEFATYQKFEIEVFSGNEDPVANAVATTGTTILAGMSVTFDATASYDPDGTITSYEWDFDEDGFYSETPDDDYTGDPWNPTHSFTLGDGSIDVMMKVTDNMLATDEIDTPITITVTTSKNIDITNPDGEALDICIDHASGDILVLYDQPLVGGQYRGEVRRYNAADGYSTYSTIFDAVKHHLQYFEDVFIDYSPDGYWFIGSQFGLNYEVREVGYDFFDGNDNFIVHNGMGHSPAALPLRLFDAAATYYNGMTYYHAILYGYVSSTNVATNMRGKDSPLFLLWPWNATGMWPASNCSGFDRLDYMSCMGAEFDPTGNFIWFVEDTDHYAARFNPGTGTYNTMYYANRYFGTGGGGTDSDDGVYDPLDITVAESNNFFILDMLSDSTFAVKGFISDGSSGDGTTPLTSFTQDPTWAWEPIRIDGSPALEMLVVLMGDETNAAMSIFSADEIPDS